MSTSVRANTLLFALILSSCALAQNASRPRVFEMDAATVQAQKLHPNPTVAAEIKHEADSALRMAPVSVVDKPMAPPGGDKHDYMSLGRYFWPNPKTPDHLPYLKKDGESNPEIRKFRNHDDLAKLAPAARALALQFYLTGEVKYAEHAEQLLRVWFLNPDTFMRPSLKYAQGHPGVVDGSKSGVLDARPLEQIVDALGLLEDAPGWTAADKAGMKKWFGDYYVWLTTSPLGKGEGESENNHGTWYAAQAVSIALYLGKTDDAKKMVEAVKTKRIPSQIKMNGDQPLELARTNSWGYSNFNLAAMSAVAPLAKELGVDLWSPTAAGAVSTRNALDALVPYIEPGTTWPHSEIQGFHVKEICEPLGGAIVGTHDRGYAEAFLKAGCTPSVTRRMQAGFTHILASAENKTKP